MTKYHLHTYPHSEGTRFVFNLASQFLFFLSFVLSFFLSFFLSFCRSVFYLLVDFVGYRILSMLRSWIGKLHVSLAVRLQ